MSNEHLTEVGQSAVDETHNGNGHDDDEGPLDPSVFFGLFDDLVDDDTSAGDALPGQDHDHHGRDSDGDVGSESDPDSFDGDTRPEALVESSTTASPYEGPEPATLDGPATFGEPEDVPTEPADPPAATGEPEAHTTEPAGPPAATGEPEAHTNDDDHGLVTGGQAVVNWWATSPESQPHGTYNGGERSLASPPPVPAQPDPVDSVGFTIDEPIVNETELDPGTDGTADLPFSPVEARSSLPATPEPPVLPTPPAVTEPEVVVLGESTPAVLVAPADVDRPGGPAADERRESGGTLAKAVLATLTIGLFAGLIGAFVISLRNPDPTVDDLADGATVSENPAGTSVVEAEPPAGLAGAIAAGTGPTGELLAEHFAAALPVAAAGRLDLTSLRFEPGTAELDPHSAALVGELGAYLAEQPSAPVTVTVRTYTEPTAAANLALSARQAEALAAALVAAGAGTDQVRVQGLGAGPLSRAQPVPNFVALTPAFGDQRLSSVLRDRSPFTFGSPAVPVDDVWPLRLDGLWGIGEVADALALDTETTLGAAGYSFFPPSEAAIRTEADAAVAAFTGFLVDGYGLDPARIATIIPGSAVFVPTAAHGNHIWVQIGPSSLGAFDVAGIDAAAITFEPASDQLDDAGAATVEALAGILTTGGATIIVDVRAYDSAGGAADGEANLALSEARRDTLTEALITAGVAPEQLRMYASGASSYVPADSGTDITITVAP